MAEQGQYNETYNTSGKSTIGDFLKTEIQHFKNEKSIFDQDHLLYILI